MQKGKNNVYLAVCHASDWCVTLHSKFNSLVVFLFFLKKKNTHTSYSLFLNCIYFNWRIMTLQYCDGFCHALAWISHRYPRAPHPLTPLHDPQRLSPPGCHRALALGARLHASNSHWSSILHVVVYMFQCYSLKP